MNNNVDYSIKQLLTAAILTGKLYNSSRLKQIIAEKDAMDKLSDKDKTLTK